MAYYRTESLLFQETHGVAPVTAAALDISKNTSVLVQLNVLARRSDNGATKSWSNLVVTLRRLEDEITLVATSPGVVQQDAEADGWNIVFNSDSGTFLIQVQGQLNTAFYINLVTLTLSLLP